jgi:hypothetical protein
MINMIKHYLIIIILLLALCSKNEVPESVKVEQTIIACMAADNNLWDAAMTGCQKESISDKYANFTIERKLVLEKMGEFFDKTIRANFPAETDTMSYKAFFHCIFIKDTFPESQYILQVDRKRLTEINAELFKDENYYFFYSRYSLISVKSSKSDNYYYDNDSIPTFIRYLDDIYRWRNAMGWWYYVPKNHNGYFRRIMEQYADNPSIRNINAYMEATMDIDISIYMGSRFDIREMNTPLMKQFAAVMFWRYICFCGGVNFVERKGLCDEYCN